MIPSEENNICICNLALNPVFRLPSLYQDHVFRIDPSKVEDGKGKSPYDPRHNAASVLVGELKSYSCLKLNHYRFAVAHPKFRFMLSERCRRLET